MIFKGLNGQFKIMTATQYITRIKDSTNKSTTKNQKKKLILTEVHVSEIYPIGNVHWLVPKNDPELNY